MKKRLLSLLMVLTMLATLLPVGWVSAAEETADTETIQLPASSIQLPYSLIQDGNAGIKSHDNARDGQFLDNMVRNDVVCLARDLDLTGLEQIVLSVAHAQTAGVKYGFYIDGHKGNLSTCIAYATGVRTPGWQDFTEIVAEWTDAVKPSHLSGKHDLYMRIEGEHQLGGNYDYVDLTVAKQDAPAVLEMETLFDEEHSATAKADIGKNDAASGGSFIDHTVVGDLICLGEHDLTDLDEIVLSVAFADAWVEYGFYVDGTDTKIAGMKVTNTGGWGAFKAFSAPIAHDLPLSATQGTHTLYLKIESSATPNGGNMDTLQLNCVKPVDGVVYAAKKINFSAFDAKTGAGNIEDSGVIGNTFDARLLLCYNNISFDGLNDIALTYMPEGASEVNLYKGNPDNGGEKFASVVLDSTDINGGDQWYAASNQRTTLYDIAGHDLTGIDTLYFEFIKKSDFAGNLASFTLYYEKEITVPAEKIILTEDMISATSQAGDNWAATKVVDGNATNQSYWESNGLPATLSVDLKKVYAPDSLVFKFDLSGTSWGTRTQTLHVTGSLDGLTFSPLTDEETITLVFEGSKANAIKVKLNATTGIRYIHLEFLTTTEPKPNAQLAELEAYGEETTAPVDKTNLKALIAGVEASAGDQDRYTDDSLATLMSAYTTAKQVDANENATQKEVDDATAALDAAIKGLQLKPTPDPEPPTEELARPNSLLVLGDSIANGDASSQRYGDLIAADLGLQQNVAYFNQAVGGHTTSDCLTIAQNIPVNLGAPDVISVSIGGNDVQYALWNAPLASNKTELLALLADREANQARIDEVQAKQQELGNDPTCLANIERAGENINKIFAALLEKFPTSTIIIQTVYNPFNWDESFCVELPVIDKLNVKIKEVAAKYDQVMVLDVAAGFEKKGSQYIANDLMHPNETGHAAIAEMYMNLWPKSDEEGPHYTMTNVSSFFDWGQDGSVVEYGGGYCWKFNNGKALALNGYTGVLTDGVSITYEIDMQVGNPGGAYSMFYGYYEGAEAKQASWYVTDFSEAVGKWHTFKFTVDSYAASQNYAGSPLVIFGYHDDMYVRSFKVYETNNPEKEVSIVFGNVEEPDAGKDVTVKFLVDDNTNFVAAEQMVTSAAELRTLYENTKVPQLWGYTTAGWDESLETLVASYDSAEEGATLVVSAVYTVDTEKTYSVTATNASTVKVGGQTVDTTVEGLTFDTRVEVTAADMLEGQSFSYWTLDGVPVCQNKSFTFYVSGNNTIEAVYGASAPTDPAVAVKHDNYITHEGNDRYTWSVVAQVFAPVGKTVTEYGVIFAPANVDLAAGFVGGTLVQGKDYLMVKASSTDTNRQYMISLIHIQAGATRQAVAYCVDSNGGYHFSEIKTKTMPTVAP